MNINQCISLINQAIGSGGTYDAKNVKGSNFYSLIYSLALIHNQVINKIDEFGNQKDVYNTTAEFIEDWEGFVGIPDDLFSNVNTTLENRVKQVILKLIGFKEITLPILKNTLLNLFNISNVEIINQVKANTFNNIILGEFRFEDQDLARNTIIVRLPKNLEGDVFNNIILDQYVFTQSKNEIVEAFIKAIKPFQYRVIFSYVL